MTSSWLLSERVAGDEQERLVDAEHAGVLLGPVGLRGFVAVAAVLEHHQRSTTRRASVVSTAAARSAAGSGSSDDASASTPK